MKTGIKNCFLEFCPKVWDDTERRIAKMGIKDVIKKNDKLYVIAKSIKSINDPSFYKLIKGYYDICDAADVILVEHLGQLFPDTYVYNITLSEKAGPVGLCARLHNLLYDLRFADFINAKPRVFWNDKMVCYDKQMDSVTRNVFEYYFDPISDLSDYPVDEFKNVIFARASYVRMYQNMITDSYIINDNQLKLLSEQYKKSIHLNSKTKEFIYKEINKFVSNSKVLGIHVRGTDFNIGLKNHPVVVSLQDYLEKAKEVFDAGQYTRVFLATDDVNAIELFSREFSNKLVYYTDTLRSKNNVGVHETLSERPLHHYKLGLEVLRDVYTLANCSSLICGLSHVSFAARYVNIALGRTFDEVVILDNGINRKEPDKMKRNAGMKGICGETVRKLRQL